MSEPVSVILSSYNQPNCLKLVLEAFRVQSDMDFEMVVADDGSDDDTIDLLEGFRESAPFDLRIVVQEHTVFRKARILNRAVSESRGGQLLFCDGDCLPFPDLIEVHRRFHRPGGFACGGYVRLTLEESRALTTEDVRAGRQVEFLAGPRRRRLFRVHRKNRFYALIRHPTKPKFLGGNFSIDRKAFYDVNGFDERFDGFSGEDSDIRNRMNVAGGRGRSLWNRAFVCHIDHGLDPRRCEASVVRAKRDKDLLAENRSRVRIEKGVDQYT